MAHKFTLRQTTTRKRYDAMPANTYTMVPIRAWEQCERCGRSKQAIDFFGWDDCTGEEERDG